MQKSAFAMQGHFIVHCFVKSMSSIVLLHQCWNLLLSSYSIEAVMRLDYQILLKSFPLTLLAGYAPDYKLVTLNRYFLQKLSVIKNEPLTNLWLSGFNLEFAHSKPGSATYGPRAGSGPPSKIIQPAPPLPKSNNCMNRLVVLHFTILPSLQLLVLNTYKELLTRNRTLL